MIKINNRLYKIDSISNFMNQLFISMGDSVGGDSVIGGCVRLGLAFDADFVRRLVHKGLERIVESDHEVGMVDRRLSSRENRSERLISVGENV